MHRKILRRQIVKLRSQCSCARSCGIVKQAQGGQFTPSGQERQIPPQGHQSIRAPRREAATVEGPGPLGDAVGVINSQLIQSRLSQVSEILAVKEVFRGVQYLIQRADPGGIRRDNKAKIEASIEPASEIDKGIR